MTFPRSNAHSRGTQISIIVPFGYLFALFGRPTTHHLKLCGNTKFQRTMQTVHVNMHIGIDKARHQCCAVTISAPIGTKPFNALEKVPESKDWR